MTTIEDLTALADDLLCAAAVDEVDSARQKFEDAIEQYAAERVADATAVPAPPFDPAFEPPWHRSDSGPAEARKSAEPVAWIHPSYLRNRTYEYRVAPFKISSELVPLYAALPKCEPLTDEQIAEIVLREVYDGDDSIPFRKEWVLVTGAPFARAIERAHGIGIGEQ